MIDSKASEADLVRIMTRAAGLLRKPDWELRAETALTECITEFARREQRAHRHKVTPSLPLLGYPALITQEQEQCTIAVRQAWLRWLAKANVPVLETDYNAPVWGQPLSARRFDRLIAGVCQCKDFLTTRADIKPTDLHLALIRCDSDKEFLEAQAMAALDQDAISEPDHHAGLQTTGTEAGG